jgi:hypothetical protein
MSDLLRLIQVLSGLDMLVHARAGYVRLNQVRSGYAR